MTLPLDDLKHLLLDLIGPARPVAAERVAALSADDWAQLLEMARQHRLEPLLHWCLAHHRPELILPEEVRAGLASRFKAGGLRALQLQRELVLVCRILHQAHIPCVALKGAFLAYHAFPQAAMRPLRDLDILVPPADVLRAYQLLQDNGLVRLGNPFDDLESALDVHCHLPPLRSPSGVTHVELHDGVFHRDHDHEIGHEGEALPDLSEDPAFWGRLHKRALGGTEIAFESATDLAFHMIVHAVYQHQFDNGPLLLADLAYLLAGGQVDWPLFWQLAESRGQTRGCVLALRLLEVYWGPQAVVWPEGWAGTAPDMPLAQAALLMLQDYHARANVRLGQALGGCDSSWGRLGILLGRAFPPRDAMARMYPVAANSPLIYAWYPVRWVHVTWKGLVGLGRLFKGDRLQQEVDHNRTLARWLSVP